MHQHCSAHSLAHRLPVCVSFRVSDFFQAKPCRYVSACVIGVPRLGLCFGEGRKYTLLPFRPNFHPGAFARLSRWQSVLSGMQRPQTVTDWVAATRSAHTMMQEEQTYTTLWMTRSYMMAEMRAHRILRLSVKKSDTNANLTKAFPDQNRWVSRLADPTDSLQTLLQHAAFSRPVELFTCLTCIFFGSEFQKYSVAELRAASRSIARARRQLSATMKQAAHPAVVLREAMS